MKQFAASYQEPKDPATKFWASSATRTWRPDSAGNQGPVTHKDPLNAVYANGYLVAVAKHTRECLLAQLS